MKLQLTFTPGWEAHPGVKVGCSFVARQKKPFTPCACYQPRVKVYFYSRLVTRTESKGTFTPGVCYQPGVKIYLYSRLVTRTGSKGFFLAGHETAAHLYSRLGFPPGSKGGLQFRFPPVLSNSLVKYNRNAIVFVKYIVN